jgi:hypothetical protein
MHVFRRHLRGLAVAVLAALSAVGGWSTLTHGFDHHDPDSAPLLVAHDASAHAFRSPEPLDGERPVHCVLCHWTRAHGPGIQSVSLGHTVASRTLSTHVVDTVLVHGLTAVQPPLRAPPAASAFDVFA